MFYFCGMVHFVHVCINRMKWKTLNSQKKWYLFGLYVEYWLQILLSSKFPKFLKMSSNMQIAWFGSAAFGRLEMKWNDLHVSFKAFITIFALHQSMHLNVRRWFCSYRFNHRSNTKFEPLNEKTKQSIIQISNWIECIWIGTVLGPKWSNIQIDDKH